MTEQELTELKLKIFPFQRVMLNIRNSKSPNYKKYFALVDDEDYSKISKHKWTVRFNKHILYASGEIAGKNIFMHNFIMGFKGVDHKNGNGLDNRKCNLRKATHHENMMNRKSFKKSSSKFKGVSKHIQGKWKAKCGEQYLGLFNTEEQAGIAYNISAIKQYGRFANLNKI